MTRLLTVSPIHLRACQGAVAATPAHKGDPGRTRERELDAATATLTAGLSSG